MDGWMDAYMRGWRRREKTQKQETTKITNKQTNKQTDRQTDNKEICSPIAHLRSDEIPLDDVPPHRTRKNALVAEFEAVNLRQGVG